MKVKTLNISLPKDLIEKIDIQASTEFTSRSAYIKHAIISQLKADDAFYSTPDRKATRNEPGKEQLRVALAKEFRYKSSFKEDLD